MRKLFLVSIFCFFGCTTGFEKDQYVPERVVLNNAKIIVNSKIFAELIFLEKSDNSDWCRGIAIHYLATDRYEWVSPMKGWKLKENNKIYKDIPQVAKLWVNEPYRHYEIIKGSKSVGGDSYFKLEWRGGIELSDDYRFILYQESGLFGPKDRKYKIRY